MPGAPPQSLDTVRAHHEDDVLVLQLDNPSGFPRLSRSVLAELLREFTTAARMSEVRAVVISGTEKCFAAGADISEVGALNAAEALRFSALGQSVMRAIERHAKPVVAAIRGACLGGGLDLALACHMRVAADDAVLGHPGATLGIITGWGGTARLPRVLFPGGRARAIEILASARTLSAREAYACGLVNRLASAAEVLHTAIEMVRKAKPVA